MGAGVKTWLWDHIAVLWREEPGEVEDIRLVAIGNVAAGYHHLYWVTINPNAQPWTLQITDATAPGAAIKWDYICSVVCSRHIVFDPPMEFAVGIRFDGAAAIASAIFGYV